MRIDEGEITGGFARAYDAWIVEGDDTPAIRAIAASLGGRRAAGFTVTVEVSGGATWTRTERALWW